MDYIRKQKQEIYINFHILLFTFYLHIFVLEIKVQVVKCTLFVFSLKNVQFVV